MIYKKLTSSILLLISFHLFGQEIFKDTLKITLIQADSVFVAQNLSLLAEKCNVDAAKAQIIQARLFTNPSISINQMAYNTAYKTNGGQKWLDMSDNGETSGEIQKLFRLANKRNKLINIAELSANREEQDYFDLLRTLKFSLRSLFYNIYSLQQTIKVYDKEISSLNKLIEVFQSQYEKGYISRKELLRLKSSLFSLESEKLNFSSQLIGNLADLNILLHTGNIYYLPQPDSKLVEAINPDNFRLQALLDSAYVNRYDLKMAQTDLKINQFNYAYQKAMAIPDITLSAGWDRNGSYIHNYNFVGLQIDLPFFNRNQGNIKSAGFNIEGSKYKLQTAEDQVKADVISAYTNALEYNRIYTKFDKRFMLDLDDLNKEMLKNYEKKNIGLVEFLDYYDAYKQNAVQLNTLQYNRINALENINFCVGKDIIYTK